MIIRPDKVNNNLNRLLEHVGISLVTFLCGVLGVLYLGSKLERGNREDGILIYLMNNPWAYVSVCLGVAIIANLFVFMSRIGKKNVCAVEFKDESQELIVYLMPYYSNTSIAVSMPFSEYTLEINKKESELKDKYLELTFKQNDFQIRSINGNDSYWSGQKKLIDKIIKKSSEIRKVRKDKI